MRKKLDLRKKQMTPRLAGQDLSYPQIPLTEEEKLPVAEGGGAVLSRFLTRMAAADVHDYFLPDFQLVAEELYYKGGKLSQFGLVPKEGIDEHLAMEILDGMFRSPFPNHIQKEGTIALALWNWYEVGERATNDEPSFPSYFRWPGTQGSAYDILVGKNRN